jgi:hypothetical protein
LNPLRICRREWNNPTGFGTTNSEATGEIINARGADKIRKNPAVEETPGAF